MSAATVRPGSRLEMLATVVTWVFWLVVVATGFLGARRLGHDGTVAQRPIRLFGDPVLRTPCDAVDKFDGALINLVADLEESVAEPGRAGLAANQIGVSRRVFSYNIDGQVGYLVNPEIEAIEGEQEDEEGCLSIPGLWYPLRRARYARATGVDRLGNPVVVEGEGILARCIQHEVDHLNGRLFVDRLSGNARRQAMRDLRERYADLGNPASAHRCLIVHRCVYPQICAALGHTGNWH